MTITSNKRSDNSSTFVIIFISWVTICSAWWLWSWKYCCQDMKDFYLKSNRDDFYFKQGFPTGKIFIFNLCDLYLKSTRDGRFRVNDEIINVNGSSLRGLSMEQVSSSSSSYRLPSTFPPWQNPTMVGKCQ